MSNQGITGVKTEVEQADSASPEVMVGRFGSGGLIRAIEHEKGAKAFDQHFEKLGLLLKNLYEPHESPYAGQITKRIDCPAEMKPRALPAKESSAMKSGGFLLLANDREVFGSCDAGSARFQAAYILVGCKAEDVAYEIKIFLPAGAKSAEELARIYDRFLCE